MLLINDDDGDDDDDDDDDDYDDGDGDDDEDDEDEDDEDDDKDDTDDEYDEYDEDEDSEHDACPPPSSLGWPRSSGTEPKLQAGQTACVELSDFVHGAADDQFDVGLLHGTPSD